MFQVRSLTVEERRSAPRQMVTYRLDVSAPDKSVGCLLDISATGMRVRFKHGLDVAKIDALRVELPRWLELGEALETHGRFAWVRAAPSGGTEAGFAFDGLSPKETSLLQVLLQRLSEAVAEDQTARA